MKDDTDGNNLPHQSGGPSGETAGNPRPESRSANGGTPVSPDVKSWSNDECVDHDCHRAIAKVEGLLIKAQKIDTKLAKKLDAAMQKYTVLPLPRCSKLCARLVAVAKKVAFLDAPEHIYIQFFSAIVSSWNSGLDTDKKKAAKDKGHHRVLMTETLLPVWIEELKDVRKQALRAYMGMLRVQDACLDDNFDRAVNEFVRRVQSVMTSEDLAAAGWIAFHFIREVLNPLLKINLMLALKHTETAATLLDIAVRLEPAKAMCNNNQPALRAIHELLLHVEDSLHFLQNQNGKSPAIDYESYRDAYANTRKILDGLWQIMDSAGRSYMSGPYSALKNLLGEPKSQPIGIPEVYHGDRSSSKTKKKIKVLTRPPQRGKQETHDPLKDQQFMDQWKASGLSGKEFSKEENISYKEFIRRYDRVRARNRLAVP